MTKSFRISRARDAAEREFLRLIKRTFRLILSLALRICCAKLHFCMRLDLRSPTNVSARVTNLRIFSEHRLPDKSPLGTERHVSRNVSSKGGNRREKSFVRAKRGYLFYFESTSHGIVRGITLPVVANTIAMNISPRDFANARGQEERSVRRGILPISKCF